MDEAAHGSARTHVRVKTAVSILGPGRFELGERMPVPAAPGRAAALA